MISIKNLGQVVKILFFGNTDWLLVKNETGLRETFFLLGKVSRAGSWLLNYSRL